MQRFIFDVDMADGTEHRGVVSTIADQVNFSTTRQRHKWPTMQEDPVLAQNYMAFCALRRTGLFDGGWDAFTNQALAVGVAEEPVDPTPPATMAG